MLNATSNCRYGLCDGSGFVLRAHGDLGVVACACECREELIYENRLVFAKIPTEFENLTLNSFSTDIYIKEDSQGRAIRAKQACVKFVREYEQFKERGKGLYFFSQVKGSGKTRLAISVGNALMKTAKLRVRYITTLDLLGEIKKTYNRESEITENDVIDAVSRVDLLILDDVGVEDGEKTWVMEKMFQILDYRMTRKQVTLFTSNVPVDELKHGDRIKSRIRRMAFPVMMPEESVRDSLAEKENDELSKILFG